MASAVSPAGRCPQGDVVPVQVVEHAVLRPAGRPARLLQGRQEPRAGAAVPGRGAPGAVGRPLRGARGLQEEEARVQAQVRARRCAGWHRGRAWHWCLCSVPRLSNGSEWLFHGKDEVRAGLWGHGVAGGCGGGQQCPRGHGWSERSRGTQGGGWLFPGGHQWCPGVCGVAVSCPGDVVVASTDRGTQGRLGDVASSGQQCSEGKGMTGGAMRTQ